MYAVCQPNVGQTLIVLYLYYNLPIFEYEPLKWNLLENDSILAAPGDDICP